MTTTGRTRNVRRAALQVMYQLDAGGEDRSVIRRTLDEAPGGEDAHARGFELAEAAWERRSDADRTVADLAPQWPPHRQPMIDRNILRLAWYELHEGEVPARIVLNESIELAKEFGTDQSARFINGVLDRVHHGLATGVTEPDGAS